MTENFKTTEFDKLIDVKSVKVPFSGGSYKQINDNIKRAIKYNPNIKYVVRGLDMTHFFQHKDYMRYMSYPEYLTDDNYINDIKYLLNKSIFIREVSPLINTYNNNSGTIISFDEAYNWNYSVKFGKNSVLNSEKRAKIAEEKQKLTNEQINIFQENMEANIIETIKNNPDIEFYYFLTPYSICAIGIL